VAKNITNHEQTGTISLSGERIKSVLEVLGVNDKLLKILAKKYYDNFMSDITKIAKRSNKDESTNIASKIVEYGHVSEIISIIVCEFYNKIYDYLLITFMNICKKPEVFWSSSTISLNIINQILSENLSYTCKECINKIIELEGIKQNENTE
jgi:hypothetical protein